LGYRYPTLPPKTSSFDQVIVRPFAEQLPCRHMSLNPWPASFSLAPRGVGSHATTCPRTHGMPPFVPPHAGWAPAQSHVPGSVVSFLCSTPLWGGFLLCRVFPSSRWARVPPCVPGVMGGFPCFAPLWGRLLLCRVSQGS
jgi:hypothetical protein